jgi:hypothetical protein
MFVADPIFLSRIQDTKISGIRICNKELSIFNPKILVGNMIRVDYSHPDPGSRGQKALDPGSGSLVESNLFSD